MFEIIKGEGIIPHGTRVIPSGSFYNCNELEKIIIPDTVLKIEKYAFYNCPNLKEIFIPCTVSLIEHRAFGYCPSVEKIVVDEENPRYDSRENCNAIVITEKNSILFGCRFSLDNCPRSIRRIESEAFIGCETHCEVLIPESIKSIGTGAFCDALGMIVALIDDRSIKTIPEGAFAGCRNLRTVKLWSRRVNKIAESAFAGANNLSKIEVPVGEGERYSAMLPYPLSGCIEELELYEL